MIALWLVVHAHAHTPQAGLVEVVLDAPTVGTLRWRAPDTGPAAGLAASLPDGCVTASPDVRRGEGFTEAAATFRCDAAPEGVALVGVQDVAQVVVTVLRPGEVSRRLASGPATLSLDPAPPAPWRVPPAAAGAGLLTAGLVLWGTRARPLAHALGVLGAAALFRWLLAV